MNKELFDSHSAMYVLGYLMNNPTILMHDKYLLTPKDFTKTTYQVVYGAIYNLAISGAKRIQPQDISIYIAQYGEQYKDFTTAGGLQFVEKLSKLGVEDEPQFNLHYGTVKKFTILRDLERVGIDTREFYDPGVDFLKMDAEMEKLNQLTCEQIVDKVRLKVSQIERNNIDKTGEYFQDVAEGIEIMLEGFTKSPDIGPELDGEYFNYIINGARPTKMLFISAPTSHGKTRTMVGSACRLSLPRIENGKIIIPPDLRRSFYVATEQTVDEIQRIIIACVSGVPEGRIKKNQLTEDEKRTVKVAAKLIKQYRENLYLDRISSPNINNVKARITERIIEKQIDNVFYDYIFIPTDSEEARGSHQYRSDQNLMRMSNMLKEIAVTYEVFMVSGSQMSNDWEGAKVRDTKYLRDAKSLADKIDTGVICNKISPDELAKVKSFVDKLGLETPNYVIDVYKNRDSDVEICKIFSRFDFGIARRRDLFVTTPFYDLIENIGKVKYQKGEEITLLDFLTREENL